MKTSLLRRLRNSAQWNCRHMLPLFDRTDNLDYLVRTEYGYAYKDEMWKYISDKVNMMRNMDSVERFLYIINDFQNY